MPASRHAQPGRSRASESTTGTDASPGCEGDHDPAPAGAEPMEAPVTARTASRKSRPGTLSWLLPTLLLGGCALLGAITFADPYALPATPPVQALLINSYDQRMRWVRELTAEVEAELAPPGGNVLLRVENMDTKAVHDDTYFAAYAAMLRTKYATVRPTLLLCSDDHALNFLRRYRDTLFPGVPVVFGGANNFTPARVQGMSGVTGVTEEHYPYETAHFLLRAHPGVEEIFVINDYTESGRSTAAEMAETLRPLEGRVRLRWNSDVPLDDLLRQVAALGPETAILLGVYYSDASERTSTYEEAGLRIATAARVPVYCVMGFNLGGSVVGGKLVTGQSQGHIMAEMGRRILAGEDPASITVRRGPGEFLFDYAQLRRWRISEASLPPGSEVVERPFSVYSAHAREIHVIAAFVAAMIVTIAALAVVMRRRARTEAELRKLRNLLGNILDSMPSVVVGVSPEGRIIQWNRQAVLMTGVSPSAALGRNLEEVFPRLAPQLPRVREALDRQTPVHGERLTRTDNGAPHYEDVTVFPLAANGMEGAVIRLDDVTERERVREMMIQTERMLSVGGLAAGMAHEINNPLGGILQAVQNVLRRIEPGRAANDEAARAMGCTVEQVRDYLERRGVLRMAAGVREAGLRAARIVANMLNFSRRSTSSHMECDIGALVATAVDLAANDYSFRKNHDFRRLRVDVQIPPDLPKPACLATEVEQVLLNLLRNAAQALAGFIPPNGAPPTITVRAEPHPDGVAISVSDNGPGMPPEVRAGVFDPFYTTRPPGEGTGLGLSVAFFIITQNHKGTFAVVSEPGQGATFTFTLPLGGTS
ncbi:ATP-binding protein [Nitratidesulfovibrio liaohensis]|uniref:histidine kinase n=1 Tax=Nitratidesulfovibrio liaohensis TaxID=2604158 RepID=A0ABY9R6A2_9BACT|nr:ATP-binding protein [Nitratidesulfovibrio liaohensis]WMW66742.1 ATP-binding protein [Nitratidesulfovibrio liaohensis]